MAQRHMENIDPRGNRIAFMGDTHGRVPIMEELFNFCYENGVKTIFHVGDYGIFAPNITGSAIVSRILKDRDINMFVTFGNHDDYSLVRSMKDSDDMWKHLEDNVTVFNRPAMFMVGDKQFFSVSGAGSIDKNYRCKDFDWWEEEALSLSDMYRIEDSVNTFGSPDVMITHEGPLSEALKLLLLRNGFNSMLRRHIGKDVLDYTDNIRDDVSQAVALADPQQLFHGHHHIRYDGVFNNTKVHGLPMESMAGSVAIFDLDTMKIEAESPEF